MSTDTLTRMTEFKSGVSPYVEADPEQFISGADALRMCPSCGLPRQRHHFVDTLGGRVCACCGAAAKAKEVKAACDETLAILSRTIDKDPGDQSLIKRKTKDAIPRFLSHFGDLGGFFDLSGALLKKRYDDAVEHGTDVYRTLVLMRDWARLFQ